MPLANTPEVFGLHPNAEIGYYTSAAKEMWSHVIDLQPQTGQSLSLFHIRHCLGVSLFFVLCNILFFVMHKWEQNTLSKISKA